MKNQCCTNQLRKKIECYSYGLNDRIGRGYSSVVYRGLNDDTSNQANELEQPVAVKVVDLKSLKDAIAHELLRSEISIIKKLRHPNLLRCDSVLMTKNNCYIVTEFCSGGDLASYLRRRGRLHQPEALELIRDIFNGFKQLAEKNIIHRDIKPANILLSGGNCRIADFGFARYDRDPTTREKYNVGTPLYMSPQALLANIYTIKNDIWALGVMFYQMLHGNTPWNCRTEKQLIEQIKSLKIQFKVPVSKELQQLIQGCLQVQEENRLDVEQIAGLMSSIFKRQNKPVHLPNKSQEYKNQPLLKTCININRLLFKLYSRLSRLVCEDTHKSYIISFVLNWLRLGVDFMVGVTHDKQLAESLGIKNYDRYSTTNDWRKIVTVIKQYQAKYGRFLEEKQQAILFEVKSLNELYEQHLPTFKSAVACLQITMDSEPEYVINVDYLLTLVQIASLIGQYGMEFLSQNTKLQLIIDVPPTSLPERQLKELMYKRATILSPSN